MTGLCQMRMRMMWPFCQWGWSQVRLFALVGRERQPGMSLGTTKPLSLSLSEYCNTDGDAAILSLSGETPLPPPGQSPPQPPPGQSHVGVVSTNLQWGLKHFVAEPVVAQQKTVLGENIYRNVASRRK